LLLLFMILPVMGCMSWGCSDQSLTATSVKKIIIVINNNNNNNNSVNYK